jgi:hypothetical protein
MGSWFMESLTKIIPVFVKAAPMIPLVSKNVAALGTSIAVVDYYVGELAGGVSPVRNEFLVQNDNISDSQYLDNQKFIPNNLKR